MSNWKHVKHFLADETGPTAVEYAVMLMLILLAAIGAIQAVGNALNGSFTDTNDKINAAGS